jgi:sulfite reductase beta subunit-like hemoprotein
MLIESFVFVHIPLRHHQGLLLMDVEQKKLAALKLGLPDLGLLLDHFECLLTKAIQQSN